MSDIIAQKNKQIDGLIDLSEKLTAEAEALAVRVEGIILSLDKHGHNINVEMHTDWLREAMARWDKYKGEK